MIPSIAILGLAVATAGGLAAYAVALRRRLAAAEARLRTGDGSALIKALANELRTPLTTMISFAEAARAPSLEPDRRGECLGQVIYGCREMVHVVHDLCDLARIERDELTIHAIDCRLDDVLDQVAAEVRPAAAENGLLIALRVEDDVPQQVRLDPTRVAQVLRLGLAASVRATRVGHAGIRVELHGRQLAFRIHGSNDPSQPSAGPGIALAARLAAQMGGSLVCDEGSGADCAFTFELPFVPATSTPDAEDPIDAGSRHSRTAQPSRSARFDGRVLVVEDEHDNQLLIRHVLQQFGLQTDIAENGRVALNTLAEQRFDLVLMDIQMPILDGCDTTRQLRERGERVPIVALTAHSLAGERDRCTAAGCDDFLTKPLDRPSLLRILSRFLPTRNDVTD